MNRREILKTAGLVVGHATMPAMLTSFFQRCSSIREGNDDWTPEFLTGEQAELVQLVSERVIPATDTPGANDALVHVFIDLFIKDCYEIIQQDAFTNGLGMLDEQAKSRYKMKFSSLEPPLQDRLLGDLEQEDSKNNIPFERSFIKMIKNLTLLGYFTSREGATKGAEYMPVPGPFQGCIALLPAQKVSAL